MNRLVKKVTAVGACLGVAMMAVPGAHADLGDLPEPFVKNNKLVSAAIVVGNSLDNAAGSTLQEYFTVSGSSGDAITFSDDFDEEDDVRLDGDLSGFGEVDSGLVDGLFEGEIEVNDTDYTAREVFNFSSLVDVDISSATGDDEFGETPYLTYDADSIFYGYAFTDEIPSGQVSTTKELDLTFLGMDIEVTAITNGTTDQVTIDIAEKVSLDSGESYSYKGHTVTLDRVYSSSVAVTVDGIQEIISEDAEDDVGDDISVEVDAVGYSSDDPSLSSAVLKLSEQGVSSTAADGAAFELFEDFDTNTHSPWRWDVEINSGLQRFGIVNRWTIDDVTPSQSYKPAPFTVGESLLFPNDFAALHWEEVTTDTYATFEITLEDSRDFEDADDSTQSLDDRPAVIVTSNDGEYLEAGNTDYNIVYIAKDAATGQVTSIWAEDDDGEHNISASTFDIKYNDDDETITVAVEAFDANNNTFVNITANDWELEFPWNFSNDFFGTEDGDAESDDLVHNGTNIGTEEYTYLLSDGTIVGTEGSDVEADLNTDKIVIRVPSQDVEATFRVYLVEGVGEAMPDIESPSKEGDYDNVVLVGGPCVNSATAEWMGLPAKSCEGASTLSVGQGLIRMVEDGDRTALIVAGWEQADTARAANAVAAGGLTGMETSV